MLATRAGGAGNDVSGLIVSSSASVYSIKHPANGMLPGVACPRLCVCADHKGFR